MVVEKTINDIEIEMFIRKHRIVVKNAKRDRHNIIIAAHIEASLNPLDIILL